MALYKNPRTFECIREVTGVVSKHRYKKGELVKIKKMGTFKDPGDFNNFVNDFRDRAGLLLIHFREITQNGDNNEEK